MFHLILLVTKSQILSRSYMYCAVPSGFSYKRKHCMVKRHLYNICQDGLCISGTMFCPFIKVDQSLILRILFLNMQCLIKIILWLQYSFPPETCFMRKNCRAGICCQGCLEFWEHTLRVPMWEQGHFTLGEYPLLRRWHLLILLNIRNLKPEPSSLTNSIIFWDRIDLLREHKIHYLLEFFCLGLLE